jgi:hypothetical protein
MRYAPLRGGTIFECQLEASCGLRRCAPATGSRCCRSAARSTPRNWPSGWTPSASRAWTRCSTRLAPKVLAGYSDVTAVLEAAASRLGWASLLSPVVASTGPAIHYSFASMLRALMHPERATDIRYPAAATVTGGTARGVTMGGNLTLLTSSLGTDTCWPARGGIVLVEETNERDYRLDRMLTQLRRSGYLDGVAGIVAGTFTGCGEQPAVGEILAERLGSLGVPMIAWANVGHGGYFQTFPVGAEAVLDADAGTLTCSTRRSCPPPAPKPPALPPASPKPPAVLIIPVHKASRCIRRDIRASCTRIMEPTARPTKARPFCRIRPAHRIIGAATTP